MKMTEIAISPTAARAHASAMRRGWRTFRVTLLGVLLTYLNTSSLNVVVPGIVAHFGAGPAAGNWVLLGYMLVHTVFVLIFGSLGDIIGRKRLYLAGLAVFILASLGSAAAPTIEALIVLRLIQAVGASAIITNTTSLLSDAFPANGLAIGLGFNTTTAALAQVLGPFLGGAVASLWGWQAVFLFNVPFGMAALWFGCASLRDQPRRKVPFDWTGSALFALALTAILYVLSVVGLGGMGMAGWLALCVAAGVFPAFLQHQRRAANPLIDLRVFRDRALAVALGAALVMSMVFGGTAVLGALYLRTVAGLSPFAAGMQILALAAGMMVLAPVAGQIARRLAQWKVALAGISAAAAALLALAMAVQTSAPHAVMMLALFGIGAGYGGFMTPNTASIMLSVEKDRRGIVNGLRSVMLNTGMVLGTSIGLAIVAAALPETSKAALYGDGLQAAPDLRLLLVSGFRNALLFFAVVTMLAALLMFRIRRRHGGPTPNPMKGSDEWTAKTI